MLQLVGWFIFGSLLILKGAFLNAISDDTLGGFRSLNKGPHTLTEELGLGREIGGQYKVPYIKEWIVSTTMILSFNDCLPDYHTWRAAKWG